jgi:hypothetical protein
LITVDALQAVTAAARMAIDPISKSRLASVPNALSRPLFVAAPRRALKAGEVLFAAGDAGEVATCSTRGCSSIDHFVMTITAAGATVRHVVPHQMA